MLSMQVPISFDKAHGLPPCGPSMVVEFAGRAGRLNEFIPCFSDIEVNLSVRCMTGRSPCPTQHLLILLEEEVCDGGDCTDMVHAAAEGQCVADIARALERRNKSGVYRILALNGGIAPEPRRRAAGALRLEER